MVLYLGCNANNGCPAGPKGAPGEAGADGYSAKNGFVLIFVPLSYYANVILAFPVNLVCVVVKDSQVITHQFHCLTTANVSRAHTDPKGTQVL